MKFTIAHMIMLGGSPLIPSSLCHRNYDYICNFYVVNILVLSFIFTAHNVKICAKTIFCVALPEFIDSHLSFIVLIINHNNDVFCM